MTKNQLQTPTAPTARIELLDVLPGFAIWHFNNEYAKLYGSIL